MRILCTPGHIKTRSFDMGPAFRVTKHNSSLEKERGDGGRAQNRPCQNSFRTRSNQAWKEDQEFFPQQKPNIHLVNYSRLLKRDFLGSQPPPLRFNSSKPLQYICCYNILQIFMRLSPELLKKQIFN